jgi:DNA-binding transcriptional regulator YiaG
MPGRPFPGEGRGPGAEGLCQVMRPARRAAAWTPAFAGERLRLMEIHAIRERVSQPVFARYLNVSKNLVSDWERGTKRPGGPALRLLSIVRRKGLEAIA